MKLILSLLAVLASASAFAQRECASHEYLQQELTHNPSLEKSMTAVERFVQRHKANKASRISQLGANPVIRIPVVVHVIYNTPAQNIPDEQIHSQLAALNRDFRKKNEDTVNTPAAFKHLAVDAEIEFVLATADAKGRATTGIVRKKTSVGEWTMNDKIKFSAEGGDDAWDGNTYLSIWVGNLRKLLGYASAPGGPAEKNGIVIHTAAFGTVNVAPPYHLGRTAVHEVGHWLGLRHIWGDAACGDDLVDDTPKQSAYTMGCPSGARTSCGNATTGDMYMNYMDFTNDACLNLFTKGQRERMRALFGDGGPRNGLLFSKGLNAPWAVEMPLPEVAAGVRLYPNPVQSELTVSFGGDESWKGKEIRVLSMNGTVMQKVIVTSLLQRISLHRLPTGVYFLQGQNNALRLSEKFVKL